jgi:hypothetical protein
MYPAIARTYVLEPATQEDLNLEPGGDYLQRG